MNKPYFCLIFFLTDWRHIRRNFTIGSETRVTSYKLRVESLKPRVEIQIHELRVQIHELRVRIHEFKNH